MNVVRGQHPVAHSRFQLASLFLFLCCAWAAFFRLIFEIPISLSSDPQCGRERQTRVLSWDRRDLDRNSHSDARTAVRPCALPGAEFASPPDSRRPPFIRSLLLLVPIPIFSPPTRTDPDQLSIDLYQTVRPARILATPIDPAIIVLSV
ncbi:hypothetical protein VTN00DRAFT_6065 [Thermoascus crustaceus]|uniref:uncharacterized protein n=1 Tax=Thermoascus crustaceus TaxID=5088 RepID=UPI003744291B